MATDQSSSEPSTPQKRQRRVKQDPQFIFGTTATASPTPEPSPVAKKPKPKSVHLTNEDTTGADLYDPGDVVWSKLGSFPWWPALIYRCDAEDGSHTRTLNSNSTSKRQFFVYFYGKYLEYAWLSTPSLLKYAGLESFIQHAETAVEQASTKSEKVKLANRYQLKVSVKKRAQWDDAIALADRALAMTRAERIQEFRDLLDVAQNKKESKNGTRRRKISTDNKSDDATPNKRRDRPSSSSFAPPDEKEQQRGQKSNGHNANPATDSMPKSSETQMNQTTSSSSTRANQQTRKSSSHSEIEYDYPNDSNKQPMSTALLHLFQARIPPLSNYELRQIAEGLLHHPNASRLSFDEAQRFAIDKAIEIVDENYQHRMNSLSSEWFYDAILLKHPSIVFKYRSWFEQVQPKVMPDEADALNLKRWQIALMIQAQMHSEQQAPPSDHS